MQHQPAPRSLVTALYAGSALIVGLAIAAHVIPAVRWPLYGAALSILAVLTVIVAAHNGRPETIDQENRS